MPETVKEGLCKRHEIEIWKDFCSPATTTQVITQTKNAPGAFHYKFYTKLLHTLILGYKGHDL